MKSGILGSGLTGGKIGAVLARLGHEDIFSYSCSELKLRELARQGGDSRAATPRMVAEGSDVIVLSVHWSRVKDALAQTGDLSGKLVLSVRSSISLFSDLQGVIDLCPSPGSIRTIASLPSFGALGQGGFGTGPWPIQVEPNGVQRLR